MEANFQRTVTVEFSEDERELLKSAMWGDHVKTRSDVHDHVDDDEVWPDVRTARAKATRPGADEFTPAEVDEMADHLTHLDPEVEGVNELVEALDGVLSVDEAMGSALAGEEKKHDI